MTLPTDDPIWQQAVEESAKLIEKHGLDRCLLTAKKLADDVDGDRMAALFDSDESSCAVELMTYACAYFGIRQLYAALLFCAGNRLGAEFQYRAYQFAAAQATRELDEFLRDEKE